MCLKRYGHHWLRKYFNASQVPILNRSHCWDIVNCTIESMRLRILNQSILVFISHFAGQGVLVADLNYPHFARDLCDNISVSSNLMVCTEN